MIRQLAARLVALAMLFGACADGGTEPTVLSTPATSVATVATASTALATIPGGPVGLFASSLVEFDTCDAFLEHIKSVAVERVGP